MNSTFVEHVLPNGLRVVCEVMPRVGSAAVGFLARTGSRYERAHEHGVSHYLEHMCFKGSARRSCREINVRFDELGSIYNAFTGKEHTFYYGWVPAARLDEQIELLADMLRPSIPAADFETERQVILEEIAMSEDSFDHHVWNFLHGVAFGGQRLAHEILGEKETISTLARETMIDYHRRRYAADNVILLAAGAVEPEAVFAAAGRYCGDWNRAPDRETNGHPLAPTADGLARTLRLERFQQQTVIEYFPSVPQNHPETENIEAFVSLFGGVNSRCYWNIVQKGICPQAGAAWVSYQDCGLMVLHASGEPGRVAEMLAALRAQAQIVAQDGFRADEVQRVKNRRRTQLALEAESPKTRLMQLMSDIECYGYPKSAQASLAEVEAVSGASIAAYLRRYPITQGGTLLSCGPRDGLA